MEETHLNPDIAPILRDWDPEPGQGARKVTGLDGREKVQLRVRVGSFEGLIQFECDGRPDGAMPHGQAFALDHYEEAAVRVEAEGKIHFSLGEEEAKELFEESTMVYERYVILLSLEDYDRVIRDTERNMRLFRFVHLYAARTEDRNHLGKWWPYILRIHGLARIEKAFAARDFDAAFQALRESRRAVEALPPQADEVFQSERKRTIQAFAEAEERLYSERPRTEVERLEKEKAEAVREQDYERAAVIRDKILALKTESEATPKA